MAGTVCSQSPSWEKLGIGHLSAVSVLGPGVGLQGDGGAPTWFKNSFFVFYGPVGFSASPVGSPS